jgi:hypothetical protein
MVNPVGVIDRQLVGDIGNAATVALGAFLVRHKLAWASRAITQCKASKVNAQTRCPGAH